MKRRMFIVSLLVFSIVGLVSTSRAAEGAAGAAKIMATAEWQEFSIWLGRMREDLFRLTVLAEVEKSQIPPTNGERLRSFVRDLFVRFGWAEKQKEQDARIIASAEQLLKSEYAGNTPAVVGHVQDDKWWTWNFWEMNPAYFRTLRADGDALAYFIGVLDRGKYKVLYGPSREPVRFTRLTELVSRLDGKLKLDMGRANDGKHRAVIRTVVQRLDEIRAFLDVVEDVAGKMMKRPGVLPEALVAPESARQATGETAPDEAADELAQTAQ